MPSDLYLKDRYLDTTQRLLNNKVIIEYDLKSANTSLCREYNLLPESKIDKIEAMDKKKRQVTIGEMSRKDKDLKEGLKKGFVDIRKRFFEENHIEDNDILSIKKDAIFCLREVDVTDFGYCHFIPKNHYTSYLYLDTDRIKLEFYYSPNGTLDIKGIDDIILEKHKNFMLQFFKTLFRHLETSSEATALYYLRRFIDKYKSLKLEVGYYREFNQDSLIHLVDDEITYEDEVFIPYEHKQEHLDIDFNFFYILLPILRTLIANYMK